MEEHRLTYDQYVNKKRVIRCAPPLNPESTTFFAVETGCPGIWENIFGHSSLLDALIFRRISIKHFVFFERMLDRCFGRVIDDLYALLRATPGVDLSCYGGPNYLRNRMQTIRKNFISGHSTTIVIDAGYLIEYQRSLDPTWLQKVEVTLSRRKISTNTFVPEHYLEL